MAANPRVSNGHRYRELRRRVLAEEDRCGICGQPVDKTLRVPDPMSPTLDHIRPVSFDGALYDRSNARLAHFRCNSRRGNGSSERAAAAAQRPPVVTAYPW